MPKRLPLWTPQCQSTGDWLYPEDKLWSVLDRVGLKSFVRAEVKDLDAPVHEAGQNLSVGQRQLLCLGRALRQRSKDILLDEATSNCDAATDQSIQRIIRTAFARSTVITIVHRLPTGCPPSLTMTEYVNSTGDKLARFLHQAASEAAILNNVQLKGATVHPAQTNRLAVLRCVMCQVSICITE